MNTESLTNLVHAYMELKLAAGFNSGNADIIYDAPVSGSNTTHRIGKAVRTYTYMRMTKPENGETIIEQAIRDLSLKGAISQFTGERYSLVEEVAEQALYARIVVDGVEKSFRKDNIEVNVGWSGNPIAGIPILDRGNKENFFDNVYGYRVIGEHFIKGTYDRDRGVFLDGDGLVFNGPILNIKNYEIKARKQESMCARCGDRGNSKCSICKKVHYCSKECQKKDWKTHKSVCVYPLDVNTWIPAIILAVRKDDTVDLEELLRSIKSTYEGSPIEAAQAFFRKHGKVFGINPPTGKKDLFFSKEKGKIFAGMETTVMNPADLELDSTLPTEDSIFVWDI